MTCIYRSFICNLKVTYDTYTDKDTHQVYIESTYTHTLTVVELTKQKRFNLILNVETVSASLIETGNLFQRRGALYANALPPAVLN